MRKKIYGAAIILVVLVVSFYYYSSSATQVEIIKVGQGSIQHSVVDTGYVQSADKFEIFAQQSAKVSALPVGVGQDVAKGQIIAILESLDLTMSSQQLQIQLSQAQSAAAAAEAALESGRLDLQDAQNKFNRSQELYNAGAISKSEFDEISSLLIKNQQSYQAETKNLQSSREQIKNYQSLLANSLQKEQDLQVKSPIDGTLMQLPVEIGKIVMPGTLVVTVAQARNLEIKTDLLSDDLREIEIGQKAQITAPVLGDTVLTGEIIEIYPQAEEKQSALGVIQRRVPVIIALDSIGNLKPGYETRVSIITATKDNVLVIPREAVLTKANGEKQVMAVINGKMVFRTVKTGIYDTKNIEVVEGLSAGDQIIKDASISITEKSRVKPKQ